MPPTIFTFLVQGAVLAAAAVAGSGAIDPLFFGLLAFGAINVALVLPGTAWVRTIAVGAVAFALASSADVPRVIVGGLAWLVWPPALLLAAAFRRETRAAAGGDDVARAGAGARDITAVLIVVVACAGFFFRGTVDLGLQQTAALFVGLPAAMAIAIVYLVSPKSAIGVAFKAVTIGLLVSVLFLGEGLLCVAMSAPIFYMVALVVGAAINRIRQTNDRPKQITLSCVAIIVLLPMPFEGVSERTSFSREESVSVTRLIASPADTIQQALEQTPRFDRTLPPYLRAGFPRPVRTEIQRGAGKARWSIDFRGGEMRIDGQEPAPGTLVLELEEQRPGLMRWRAVGDDSHMMHFLQWRESVVEWTAVDDRTTQVTWTLRYRRGLDPAWYFGPWQRFAARLAAEYLIDAVATP